MGAAAGGAGLGGAGGAGIGLMLGGPAGAALGGLVGALTGYGMQSSSQAAGNASRAAGDAQKIQTEQASGLQRTMLQQPKQITPDNFLAMKSNQLANLRLGIASTISGASGSSAPTLGSTSLTGNNPGKTRFGQ